MSGMVVAVHGVEVRMAEGLWLASGVMCWDHRSCGCLGH